jgi:DNA-binding NarL/FixJ family response regulator
VLRLLLVEDHAAFRGALARLLNRQPDLEVVAQCGSLAECRSLGGFAEIDVALLDLYLPDGDGTDLITELHQANPHLKVLILTGSVEPILLERIDKVGADGLLDKTKSLAEIAAEVRRLGEDDI